MSDSLCWIHIRDLEVYVPVGVKSYEREMGQRLKLNLSLQVPYRNTEDQLAKTLNYGAVIQDIAAFIESLGHIHLLEYLAEQLLGFIEEKYSTVHTARVIITKVHVPLASFGGSVEVEAERRFPVNR